MSRRSSRGLMVMMVLVMLLALVPLAPAMAQSTMLLVDPLSQSVGVGQNVTVGIKIDGVSGLWGVDIRMTFDTSKLEVQDADPSLAGVQITPGTFLNPAQGFLQSKSADNSTGEIRYVFTLLAPATAVNGTGTLASITFKGKAAGNAVLTLTNVTLSNSQAQPIPATLMNGAITVVPGGTTPTPGPTATPGPTRTPGPTPTPGPGFTYVVQWGDTLSSIARRFGVTVAAIMAANNLTNANYIRAGQVLIIPGAGPGPTPPPGQTRYTVVAGDNLYRIAQKFGVTVNAIVAANNIINPWLIRVGQVLVIPTGGPPPPPPGRTYVVKAGDTINAIAAMYGVTPWSIIMLNNLPNPNLIFVGQVLRIP